MSYLKIRKDWDFLPESQVTPEAIYTDRRQFLKRLGTTTAAVAAAWGSGGQTAAAPASEHVPEAWLQKWRDLFPAARNIFFRVEGPLTPELLFTTYNNFYEFSLQKARVKDLVGPFEVHPWEVEIAGLVEKRRKYDLDELIRMGSLEERVYRFRCVEAWSANVPWTGYPLRQLIEKLNPSSRAGYVRFVTAYRPNQMPGLSNKSYPWPYYEAITMEEAMNDLTLLTFGLYGHPLNKQNGAPVRIILPWKYGFKSIKSLARIEFVQNQPGTLWGDVSSEYGFWANTHPDYPHARWSQANERFLNTGELIPTRIYNGYQALVGQMYDDKDRKFFF